MSEAESFRPYIAAFMTALTYFNLIPDVVIEEIVRYVSDRPRHPHWKAYLGESNACNLIDSTSPIKNLVRPLITHLTATNDNFARGNVDTLVVRGASRGIPELLGAVLDEVHLRAIPLDSSWVQQLTTKCVALRSLEVHYAMPSVHFVRMLEARGNDLTSLSAWFVGSRQHLESISKYCPNIEHLELQYLRKCSAELWRTVGTSLTSLTLSFSIALRPVETLSHVKKYCRKLTKLNILENYHGFDFQVSSIIADLYSSFGKQIEEASLRDVSPLACKDIRKHCPNIRCSAGHMHFVVDQMYDLSDTIRDLRVDFHGDSYSGYDQEYFQAAASRCSRIEKLSTKSSLLTCMWSSKFFSIFFETKKNFLSDLDWSELIPNDFCAESLRLLSKNTGSLETISLCLGGIKSLDFQPLVQGNSRLTSVELKFLRPNLDHITKSEEVEQIFISILDTFMGLNQLKYLSIDVEGDGNLISDIRQVRLPIKNAIVKYRKKNTFIMIAGVEYLS